MGHVQVVKEGKQVNYTRAFSVELMQETMAFSPIPARFI